MYVNGVNESKHYNSKLVKVPLTLEDSGHHLTALVLPSISTKLDLPRLGEVVEIFKRRGYKLADKDLSYKSQIVDNFDFILGTKSTFCLPDTDVLFGEESVFSVSPVGVLLKGEIDQIIK